MASLYSDLVGSYIYKGEGVTASQWPVHHSLSLARIAIHVPHIHCTFQCSACSTKATPLYTFKFCMLNVNRTLSDCTYRVQVSGMGCHQFFLDKFHNDSPGSAGLENASDAIKCAANAG